MPRQRGWTLIEVMIVMVILMLLVTLAYPNYASYITRSRRLEGQVALMDAMQQQERYFMRNNTYRAFSATATEPGALPPFRAWSSTSADKSAYELDASACPGQEIADCVLLRATPGTDHVDSRFRDPECGMLTLDSTGRRTASGAATNCWP